MKNIKNVVLPVLVIFAVLILVPASAFSVEWKDQGINENGNTLYKVDPAKVCMINNQYLGTQQIPVEVGGKTYYGCCQMCEKTLKTDKNSHFATDPISGQKVDKATAVIGVANSGKVYYFQNEKNLEKYNNRLSK